MTIWCQGSLQADAYYLYKEGISEPLAIRTLEDSSNRMGFRTESASSVTAGRYQCAYHTKRNGWSEQSDLLPLVVTGKGLGPHPLPLWAPPCGQKGTECGLKGTSALTAHTWVGDDSPP